MTYDLDEDIEINEDSALTVEDFKSLARNYLKVFFDKRKDLNGQLVKSKAIYTDRNVCMVLNLNICDGMALIYDALNPICLKKKSKAGKVDKVGEDVRLVISLLKECATLSIPKCFAAGLIAAYVELCKDCKINI